MPIPGKIFSLLLGSHYALEATICKESRAEFHTPGRGVSRIRTAASVLLKNRVASAQFISYVTIARPAATASAFRPSFATPREKLRLELVVSAAWLESRMIGVAPRY